MSGTPLDVFVVKLGSNMLTEQDGKLAQGAIANVVRSVANLSQPFPKDASEQTHWRPLIVTSGAIAAGSVVQDRLRFPDQSLRPHLAHVLAAVGQPKLMRLYQLLFEEHGLTVAQLMLTRSDFAERDGYAGIKNTLRCLLANNIVPIVNDNDVLHDSRSADDHFSDNDHLAAFLGIMLQARHVVYLSSAEGVYRHFRRPEQELIRRIQSEDERAEVRQLPWSKSRGKGGMKSKVKMALLLMDLGIPTSIANGHEPEILNRAIAGTAECTQFIPSSRGAQRQIYQWLAAGAIPNGEIVVSDLGAERMAETTRRGSLVFAGVQDVEGGFRSNDVVNVRDEAGSHFGVGVTRVCAETLREFKGLSSQELLSDEAAFARLLAEGLITEESNVREVIHADQFFGTAHGVF